VPKSLLLPLSFPKNWKITMETSIVKKRTRVGLLFVAAVFVKKSDSTKFPVEDRHLLCSFPLASSPFMWIYEWRRGNSEFLAWHVGSVGHIVLVPSTTTRIRRLLPRIVPNPVNENKESKAIFLYF